MNSIQNYGINFQGRKITIEQLKKIRAPYVGSPIKPGTEFVEYTLSDYKRNLQMHIAKLKRYLKENPNDIEVRTQVAKLEESLKK